MALFGTIATVRAQAAARPGFEIAWVYAEELLRAGSPVQARVRAIAPGQRQRTELGAGVFVSEECYPTKARVDGFFESHRKYIDVQIVFEGAELMEVADIGTMKTRAEYDPARDLITYEDNPAAALLRVWPGQAAVFFPSDVHMPTLRVGEAAQVTRKCVIKIPVT
jgi:YhcH/YjgK/YiaL family protein